jgi:hypothetical protein
MTYRMYPTTALLFACFKLHSKGNRTAVKYKWTVGGGQRNSTPFISIVQCELIIITSQLVSTASSLVLLSVHYRWRLHFRVQGQLLQSFIQSFHSVLLRLINFNCFDVDSSTTLQKHRVTKKSIVTWLCWIGSSPEDHRSRIFHARKTVSSPRK